MKGQSNRRKTIVVGALLGFAQLYSAQAAAQTQAPELRKWSFSLGAFLTDQDMKTELEVSNSDTSFLIDLEDDLGLDPTTSVFRIDGFYRFSGRHRLDASVFDLSRSATATLETQFEWQDTVYPIAVDVRTDLDLAIYKLAYAYEFVQDEGGYVAATAGLFVADINLEIRIPATGESEIGDVTAPLPVIGLRGGYAMSERWALHLSSEVFFIDVDEVNGLLYDLYGGFDYRFAANVAIGVGYNFVDIDLDGTGESLSADLDWRYSGAVAYLKFVF